MNQSVEEGLTDVLRAQGRSGVQPLRFPGSDAELVEALKAGHIGAAAELYERYVIHVRRVLVRIVGLDQELPDLLNEVFFQALRSVESIKDAAKLQAWITRLAVFVARGWIRKKKRRRWLTLSPIAEPNYGPSTPGLDEEGFELLSAVHGIMEKMPVNQRVVFALRFVEGMPIDELAGACAVSRATVKRRLAKSEKLFKALAQHHPLLKERLDESPKWRSR